MIKSLYALCLLLLLLACVPASGSGSRVASVAALTSTIEPITLVNSTVTPSAARPTEIPLESSVSPTAGGKCPVTLPPPAPFVPPAPYPPQAPYGNFWHGSEKLWLALPPSGTWAQLQFSDKMFWWRSGYSASQEPEPALTVTGRRLDGAAPPLKASRATNAYHKDFGGWAMLTGVNVPTPGCWEITGEYRGTKLSFVVWVGTRTATPEPR